MQRWEEERELLEEELRRLYVGYVRLASQWDDLHERETSRGIMAFAALRVREYSDQADTVLRHAKDLELPWTGQDRTGPLN